MVFGKIVVKEKYEREDDLVFRPLVRAFRKIDADSFLTDNGCIIIGVIRDGQFFELFTWRMIPYAQYEEIETEEFFKIIDGLSLDQLKIIKRVIRSCVFNDDVNMTFSASTIEELARDRAVEFDAFVHDLTPINPYEEPYEGYNDFAYKCKKLQKVK